MNNKKSKSADLRNKRVIFFEIGALVAIGAAIAFFSWGTSTATAVDLSPTVEPLPDIFEVPVTRPQSSASPQQRVNPHAFNPVETIERLIPTIEPEWPDDPGDIFDPIEPGIRGTGIGNGPEGGKDEGEIFLNPEVWPTFQGGDLNKFRGWVSTRVRYPDRALSAGITGKVTVSFIIEPDGSVSNIEVIDAPHSSLRDEAIRVISQSPAWEPGKQGRHYVRVRFTMPIEFRLDR